MWLREYGPFEAELEHLARMNEVGLPVARNVPKAPAEVLGVPFAPEPPVGSYWPLVGSAPEGRLVSYLATDGKVVGRASREFGAMRMNKETGRKDRYHLAVDLFAQRFDPVIACEDGRIVHFIPRFLYNPKYPNYSSALFVEHGTVTINYGEVHPDSLEKTGLGIGKPVKAGQVIALVGINPRGSSMLHFETYRRGVKRNQRWAKGERRPPDILNPTRYLLFLQQQGREGTRGAASSPSSPGGIDVAKAVKQNLFWGDKLGWMPFYDAIAYVLGFTHSTPNQEWFAESVAEFQRANGLSVDGVIGPDTWKRLRPRLASVPASAGLVTPGGAAPSVSTGSAPVSSSTSVPSAGAGGEDALYAEVRASWERVGLPPPDRSSFGAMKAKTQGFARYGGPYLDTTLERLRDKGLVSLSDADIDMFQRIANVETGGRLTALNTWDSAVVSIGFMQWTLKWGELQAWIRRAPAAFARYHIQVEPSRTYAFSEKVKPPAIVGARYAQDLRSREWGERFWMAGLDLDALVASVPLALAEAARIKKGYVSSRGPLFVAHYDASPEVRALIQEAYNNRPVYLKTAMAKLAERVARAGAVSTQRFLELLREEVLDAFGKERVKAERIIRKTRVRRLPP